MRNLSLILLIAVLSAFLFGCQLEQVAVKAEEPPSEAGPSEMGHSLLIAKIAKVEVSEIKGIEPVVYEKSEQLEALHLMLSNAVKEPGTANMTQPEFYLKVMNKDGENQRLYLWMGEAGEQSMLMNAEDTHSVYSVSSAMTAELIDLIEKQF